ncbi:glycine cleavage system H protein [Chryseobacterium defluvii]|uniref:Glycine cleavage system H protein n=1 Tax=Chryseobacterium defluvii TaxID=160396 RepID=A0A840KDB4_9FLAO|nr:glycine cleavage system protein H [Chryseobacterium defluvii]MBB4807156.1 glycine cleavage system H protein [Chryseobacterium defluvii]
MLVPKSLYYTKNHIWLRKIGLYDFCIGISDFAQKEIGEIHLIEFSKHMSRQGNIIRKGDCLGAVYGINKTFDLVAPCDCKIMEVNGNINIKPSHINTDPYNCWFVILSIDVSTEELLTYEDYIQITNDF